MKFRLEMCHSEVSLSRQMFRFISILFSLGELLYWRPLLIKEASFHYHFHCICNGTNTKHNAVKVQEPRPTGHGSSWVLIAPPGCSWFVFWFLLAPPPGPLGLLLAPPDPFWLLYVPYCSSWLLLALLISSWLLVALHGFSWTNKKQSQHAYTHLQGRARQAARKKLRCLIHT